MGVFSSHLINTETVEWQLDYFEFLIQNLSSDAGLPDSELQFPVPESFIDQENPTAVYQGHELAQFLLGTIQKQCGVADVAIKLVPTHESKPRKIGGGVILQTADTNAAAGRYIAEENTFGVIEETITYDQDLTKDPAQLIATFAHELSHCLHNRIREKLDFESEILYEMFTDLTAVYLGYGLFLSNARFSYTTDHDSWATKSHGYLPESDLIFATALFMQIKNIPQETALPHLKPHLRKMMKKAMKQLSKYSADVDHLKKLTPAKTD